MKLEIGKKYRCANGSVVRFNMGAFFRESDGKNSFFLDGIVSVHDYIVKIPEGYWREDGLFFLWVPRPVQAVQWDILCENNNDQAEFMKELIAWAKE